ncbi:hypothetical protein CYY_005012 [Polysphondylium violaceum]|uniref:Ubiquitin-like domain-containing protein n=1 Tax=Polysphondylium violaceum TaxID=133409 RepID=A0A8J4PVJ2_9MYCE|nr:hypothetical protein CYY_005012 [Polysphondylium violaceum]
MSDNNNNNNNNNNEEVKKEGGDQEQINIKVLDSNGGEVFFKIKKTTPLKKLMDAYSSKKGVNPSSLRFLYEGNRIDYENTPKQLNMENDDIIDVTIMQVGGSNN